MRNKDTDEMGELVTEAYEASGKTPLEFIQGYHGAYHVRDEETQWGRCITCILLVNQDLFGYWDYYECWTWPDKEKTWFCKK